MSPLRAQLLIRVLVVGVLVAGCGPGRTPNLLLVTLDTTRVDHLGCYGYGRATSPNLDALAAGALRYARAYSASSWTLPAHASLFTGRLPSSHGARFDPEGRLVFASALRGPEGWARIRANPLAAEAVTLAELLADDGYATGAVVAGPWLKRVFGLARGFEDYDDAGITALNGRPAQEVSDAAIPWIERHADVPFFLFVNYFDPHAPWDPPGDAKLAFLPPGSRPEDLPDDARRRRALYDAEILYMDRHLGRLLRSLRELGLYERTWIVVTADHGEMLGEHDRWGHGRSLTEAEIHVPLIVKEPGKRPPAGVVAGPVLLTDLLPSVVARLGLAAPPDVQGAPLPAPDHPIVAEVYPLAAVTPSGSWQALVERDFKYVWNSRGRDALIDVARDPSDGRNLIEAEPQRAARMEHTLKDYLEALPRPSAPEGPVVDLDAETQEALRRLGYGG